MSFGYFQPLDGLSDDDAILASYDATKILDDYEEAENDH
jgi:hypothetical protein